MDSQAAEVLELETRHAPHDGAWIRRVIGLLDVASRQLGGSSAAVQSAIEQATSLLQGHMGPRRTPGAYVSGGLLAWQMRTVREYASLRIRRSGPFLPSVQEDCGRESCAVAAFTPGRTGRRTGVSSVTYCVSQPPPKARNTAT
jgi:hypothetical protein